MVLAELATFIAAQSLGLTIGTNLFDGSLMPPSPDLAVALYEYPGLPDEPDLGTESIRLEFPRVQVLVRGAEEDYNTPRALIQQIVAALAKIGDEDLSGVRYLAVQALQNPFYLRRDEEYRVYFACNFQVTKYFSVT